MSATDTEIKFTLKDGRVVASIKHRVLAKRIKGKHLLNGHAIGFDADEYDRLRHEFDTIRVFNEDTGVTYSVSAADFDRLRFTRTWAEYGRQYYLSVNLWVKHDPNDTQMSLGL